MESALASLRRQVTDELRILRHESPMLPFFGTLLGLGLFNRADLYAATFLGATPALGMDVPAPKLWQYVGQEPLFAAALSLPLWLLWRLFVRARRGAVPRLFTGALLLLVFVVAVVEGTQAHLIHAMSVPLGYEMLLDNWGPVPMSELVAQLTWVDYAYLTLPIASFVLLLKLSPARFNARDGALVVSVVACLWATWTLSGEPLRDPRALPLTTNPVVFLIDEIVSVLEHPPSERLRVKPAWGEPQRHKLRLSDAAFGKTSELSPRAACKTPDAPRARNVVFVILESAAYARVFDHSRAGRATMPSLEALRDQGLFLSRHVSSNNASPSSVFSMFSGLYPWPEPRIFAAAKDLEMPSLFSLLGREYDSFLVTPGRYDWYFPYAFLKSSGMEIWGRENLQIEHPRTPTKLAVNELDAVDFFLKRLERAKPPFAAVYYSFVPHHPYYDYGRRHQLVRPVKPADRYTNGLYLLDQQLARIIEAVRKKAPAEDTLIVVLGDHGQAFGEHFGNFMHAQASYLENLRTPAVLIHPSLFPPRVERRWTSHVDLLPTVLDAMCVPYEPQLLQGQSLLAPSFEREYVYIYGQENAVSSISSAGVKLTASVKKGRAWSFDLTRDPHEEHAKDVELGDRQLEATLQFRAFQSEMLVRYKELSLRKQKLAGLAHPNH